MRNTLLKASHKTAFFGMATAVVLVSGGMAVALAAVAPTATVSRPTGSAASTSTAAPSATISATEIVAAARAGQTVVLPAGNLGQLVIRNRNFSPALRIDASAATLTGIEITASSGITIDRGRVTAPGGTSIGVNIERSQRIQISNMTITTAHRGIYFNNSQDINILNNVLDREISDGIDISQSQRVLVQNNVCSNFTPRMPQWDAAGTQILVDGDHPDCIQAWARPRFPVTSDVRILNNRATGMMQGVFFVNPTEEGVPDAGFQRIQIAHNTIVSAVGNGIMLVGGRDSDVSNNNVSTVPGAKYNRPPHFYPVTSIIRISGDVNVTACGNFVANVRTWPGDRACSSAHGS